MPLVVVIVLMGVGCGTPPPSPSVSPGPAVTPSATGATPTVPGSSSSPAASPDNPSSDNPDPASSAEVNAIYDAIELQVAEIRGLTPTREVQRQIIDEAQLRATMTELFDDESPPGYVAATERLYKALDLIPVDADLRELTLDLLGGGVAGFYRNDQNTLYIVSKTGLPGVNEQVTFAHEFGHALQDQHSSVFTDTEGILDQTDRILARQAIYEGDATLLMTYWAIANLDTQEMAELIALGQDPETQALLARMPAILEETLLFPYTTGATYLTPAQIQGGWPAVDAFYDRMPESTEQILHPEAYEARERPIAVDIPDDLAEQLGAGWTVPLEDTLGEFQLGIWLRESGLTPPGATTAISGWGGDRLAVVEGPDGAWGVILQTTWDSTADAAEFADAAHTAVSSLANPAQISGPASNVVAILVASDTETLLALDVIFGATGV